MPAISTEDSEALATALTAQGVPSSMHAAVFAAIDAGGFAITPSGGSPASVIDEVVATKKRCDGLPGYHIVEIDVDGAGDIRRILEVTGRDGNVERFALP